MESRLQSSGPYVESTFRPRSWDRRPCGGGHYGKSGGGSASGVPSSSVEIGVGNRDEVLGPLDHRLYLFRSCIGRRASLSGPSEIASGIHRHGLLSGRSHEEWAANPARCGGRRSRILADGNPRQGSRRRAARGTRRRRAISGNATVSGRGIYGPRYREQGERPPPRLVHERLQPGHTIRTSASPRHHPSVGLALPPTGAAPALAWFTF